MSVRRDAARNTWFFVLDLPRGADGKRRQMWRGGFKTEKLAAREEQEAKKKFAKVDLAADGTVAAELCGWLEERELDIAVTTLANYRHVVRTYLIPHLGTRQIYDLDKRMINDFYRLLLARGGKKGQPLAAETVRHVHRTFMKALKDVGVVIDGVRQPRRADRETPGRKGVWTVQECARFLAAVADDRLHAAWVLAIVCGMRRGELLGLKWPKVNLDNGVVYVHWQRTCANGMVKGGVVEKEPKGKSKRSIAIGPSIVEVLRRHRARQERETASAGIAYQRLGYLFCKENGTPYTPTFLTNRFRALCVQAGVPVIVLHDGRHSSATVGADHGVPQHAMQQRLGHANPRTTQEWYTHVLPEAERAAARIMEEAILGRVA